MKIQLNEIKRMQQLAGLITENSNVTPEQKALTTWKERKNGNIIDGYVFHEIKPEDMERGWSKYKSGDVAIYTKQTANDQAKLIGYFKNGEDEMLSPITESQLNENNFFGFSYKNKNKDVDTKKLMAMDEKEAFQIARKWMEKNNLDPNEIQSMKQLDQYEIEKYDEITEAKPQVESIDSVVNEALKAYRKKK